MLDNRHLYWDDLKEKLYWDNRQLHFCNLKLLGALFYFDKMMLFLESRFKDYLKNT